MIFSFSDSDFLDATKVKVIHGVAGRGKSSIVNNFLKQNNIDFLWTTSTNKLKRDAQERYNCEAATVCSALFKNENGRFYCEEKTINKHTVIIDEILQTSIKVLDWIEHNKNIVNIIIMTDTHQMLSVDNNSSEFLRRFNELMNKPYVLVDEGFETKRARDKETKDKIESLYKTSNDESTEFLKDVATNRFDIIKYEDMVFSTNDVYITHLNETEEMLYRDKKLATMFFNDDELICKGSISSKPPKDLSKYPILSQLQAERMKSQAYLQLANIGSITRYQGSEVTDKQKLYYIITLDSRITNREWYTVVSRCWTLDSIVIVIANRQTKEKLKTFNNRKIKDVRTLVITK